MLNTLVRIIIYGNRIGCFFQSSNSYLLKISNLPEFNFKPFIAYKCNKCNILLNPVKCQMQFATSHNIQVVALYCSHDASQKS